MRGTPGTCSARRPLHVPASRPRSRAATSSPRLRVHGGHRRDLRGAARRRRARPRAGRRAAARGRRVHRLPDVRRLGPGAPDRPTRSARRCRRPTARSTRRPSETCGARSRGSPRRATRSVSDPPGRARAGFTRFGGCSRGGAVLRSPRTAAMAVRRTPTRNARRRSDDRGRHGGREPQHPGAQDRSRPAAAARWRSSSWPRSWSSRRSSRSGSTGRSSTRTTGRGRAPSSSRTGSSATSSPPTWSTSSTPTSTCRPRSSARCRHGWTRWPARRRAGCASSPSGPPSEVLARPRAQERWAEANRQAHMALLKILEGGGPNVSTQGGVVTLDLKSLVSLLTRARRHRRAAAAGAARERRRGDDPALGPARRRAEGAARPSAACRSCSSASPSLLFAGALFLAPRLAPRRRCARTASGSSPRAPRRCSPARSPVTRW